MITGRRRFIVRREGGYGCGWAATVDMNAAVEAKDKNGRAALHYAAGRGHEDVARQLLTEKAEVDAKDRNEQTALHFVARGGHKNVVQLLVDHGADIDASDKDRWTTLHFSAGMGHEEVS